MAQPALNQIIPSSLQVEPGQASNCHEITSTEEGNPEKPGFYPKFPELEQHPCLLCALLCPVQLWDVTEDGKEEGSGLGSSS